jgi:hypothetical protein
MVVFHAIDCNIFFNPFFQKRVMCSTKLDEAGGGFEPFSVIRASFVEEVFFMLAS